MKLYEITFSPTGGTEKAADLMTQALGGKHAAVDLTDSRSDFSCVTLDPEDVAVIAVPSYGGRVPAPAVQRLAAIKGGGAQAVLVCVYGNRAYEDTLAELSDTAKQAGFRVIAAAAVIAEHSIVRRYAAGRPDQADAKQLREFAEKIQVKLSRGDVTEPALPGNRPYKKAGSAGLMPRPAKGCVSCGLCAQQCPVQAIDDPRNPHHIDKDRCISCMRCVSICPHSARKASSVMLAAAELMLKRTCSVRKECELYL